MNIQLFNLYTKEGVLRLHVEAIHRPSSAARRSSYKRFERDNPKSTPWIVLRCGACIANDTTSRSTVQGLFWNFHFYPHFLKPNSNKYGMHVLLSG